MLIDALPFFSRPSKFAGCARVTEDRVAVRPEAWVEELLRNEKLAKPARVVAGGDSRQPIG